MQLRVDPSLHVSLYSEDGSLKVEINDLAADDHRLNRGAYGIEKLVAVCIQYIGTQNNILDVGQSY